jgi:hypothetical protein
VKANVAQAIGLKNVAQEGDLVEQLRFAVSEGYHVLCRVVHIRRAYIDASLHTPQYHTWR